MVEKDPKGAVVTNETVTDIVTLSADEIKQMASELDGRLKLIAQELSDVEKRLVHLVFPLLIELSCGLIKTLYYITLNDACPPHWFRNVHTVMADSRLVPVVSFNSSASELPDVAVRDF